METQSPNKWFSIQRLAEGLYGIGEFGHVEEVISFLLVGEQIAILIDSGMGFFSMNQIVSSITTLPCRVINTHAHFDHVGSNVEFPDIWLFDHPSTRRAAVDGFSRGYLSQWSSAGQFSSCVPTTAAEYSIKAFPWARFFDETAVFHAKPYELTVLHTPGHSDDSVCLFEAQKGWLFGGDLLYDGPIYIERVGGLAKFRRSIASVSSLPGLTRIFSSHNYFEFSLEKLAQLRAVVERIPTADLEQEVAVQGRLRLVPG
jgi:glyoxylase-like metal-dependent hydrolase (beta-lactamase superfamily II)